MPANSAKQFDNRTFEHFDFCDKVHPHYPSRHTLSADKLYQFMWYQCFREKKVRDRSLAAQTIGATFNLAECQKLISQFPAEPGVQMDPQQHPPAANPTGYSTFSIYKASFQKLYKIQVHEQKLPPIWDQLWGMDKDDLKNDVKNRAPCVKKETHQEKVSGLFSPCTVVECYGEIEDKFWDNLTDSNNKRSINTNLRHRFSILYLTSGILWCKSLCGVELSDFLCICPPRQERDVHQPLVVINAMTQGKTNHGHALFGRATRHKDVAHCCVGALAFCVSFRFCCTREFEHFTSNDWIDNKKWFDIKLLAVWTNVVTTLLQWWTIHMDHIRKVLNALGIICDEEEWCGQNETSRHCPCYRYDYLLPL